MSVEDCRARLPLWVLWGKLGLPDAEKVSSWAGGPAAVKVLAPFREEKTPSCSLKIDGGVGLWKDFGSGDGGDEVTLIQHARGCDNREAIKIYHELAGVPWGTGGGDRPMRKVPENPVKPVGALVEKPSLAERVAGKPLTGKKSSEGRTSSGGGLGEVVEIYQYKDESGRVLHETLRYEPKNFRQRRPGVTVEEGEWVYSLKDVRTVPYRVPEILASDRVEPIFLVEGEKDVERLEELSEDGRDVVATTFPMGAGKWKDSFAKFFRDRWVVVVPDFDGPGLEGAEKVARELFEVCDRVGVLLLDDLWSGAEPGHDVSDWRDYCDEVGMMIDEQRGNLMAAAERAGLEDLDLFSGLVADGGRGGYRVLEDRLARTLVRSENLIYCGDHFWKWNGRAGIWSKVREKTWIDRKVRRVLTSQKGGEEVLNSGRVSSIVKLATSERVKFPEELNSVPEGCFPVANGLLDVEKGILYPHRHGHLTTVQIPHPYVPGADCPEWKKWLAGRHDDEETVSQIQEVFGYCLGGDINYHSFFFFYGDGGTGKSTCVDVLEWLVGSDNKVALELTELDNPFLRSQLVGKSLYLAKELTTKSFTHIGLIKAIVSGDPVSVDVKYGQGFDFRPKGRLVMESNVIAATPDSSGGFERRFIQINFDKVIAAKDREYGFQERFKAELPGILNWALEGYRRLKKRGRFVHTSRSEEATRDLMKHRAGLSLFLKDGWLEEKEGQSELMVSVNEIFELYNDWCELNDVVPHHREMPTFARELFGIRKDWKARKKRRWVESECRKVQYVTELGVVADKVAACEV
jgi:P4 family phage/plasmid primase-like protien